MLAKLALLMVFAATLAGAARADVTISNKATANMSCVSGVCTATAQKAVLNVSELQTMLGSGDVTVKTGTAAKDIAIDQPLSWTSTSRLTLDAQESVIVKKPVAVTGAGGLAVTTGKHGEFIILPERGSVQLWDKTSSLIIDGNTYTLVYDIKTLAADIANNPSGFYALANNYDASVDGTYTSAPMGTAFEGMFEGLGNAIESLAIHSINSGDLVALFRHVGSDGAIRNLRVTDASIYASGPNGIAILAGNNYGRIFYCQVTGFVVYSGGIDIGGLVGENDGEIIGSSASARINGPGFLAAVGGLVGYNYETGSVDSSYAIGSLAIRFSKSSSFGGLVGENAGIVRNSYALNRIVDGRQNSGSVFGGLTGRNDGGAHVGNTYAAGEISIKSQEIFGGLIGVDEAAGNIADSYWDIDRGISDPSQGAGNIPNDPGIAGLTTKQFQKKLPKGFDPKIWGQAANINHGDPYLLANPPR